VAAQKTVSGKGSRFVVFEKQMPAGLVAVKADSTHSEPHVKNTPRLRFLSRRQSPVKSRLRVRRVRYDSRMRERPTD
jgi:hypothetical protein